MTPDDELTEFLRGLGATDEDLAEHGDDPVGLALILVLRVGRPELSLADMAARSGEPIERVRRNWRAAGYPYPGDDVAVVSEQEAEMFTMLGAAEALFGADAIMQLTRVIGAAFARIADAIVTSLLVNVEGVLLADEAGPADVLRVARANAAAASLIPETSRLFDTVFRRHILLARRSLESTAAGADVRTLAVGFVDIVGSTALSARLSTADLGAMLSTFETASVDAVADHGGRLVKLIGDEVMYSAPDPAAACRVALAITQRFTDDPVVPPVRGGVAYGTVALRDGDCFGPVVNLAARAAKVARPGAVVASAEACSSLPDEFECLPLPLQTLKGFGEVTLFEVSG